MINLIIKQEFVH